MDVIDKVRSFSEKYGIHYMDRMRKRGWENPGRMLDELGSLFAGNDKLFFIGEKSDIARLHHELDFIGVKTDEISAAPGEFLKNDMVDMVKNKASAGYTVIIGFVGAKTAQPVADELFRTGCFFENANLFFERHFTGNNYANGNYCSIFAWYTAKKVFLKHQNMLVTTVCNLNCKYCLNYNPYNHNQRHFSFEELKKNVDTYFSHIDRVGFFELTGGDPLLCPDIGKIIDYIAANYREKIDIFAVVTNGTTIPNDQLLSSIKRADMKVLIDDYSLSVPRLAASINRLEECIKENGINYYRYPQARYFLRNFPPEEAGFDLDEDGLKRKYRACIPGFQNLRNGRLCSCTYFAFAVNAGLIEDDEDMWFDLNKMSDREEDKIRLIEFRCGFNLKGYVNWCKYCNGLHKINDKVAPAAQQADGRLDWAEG